MSPPRLLDDNITPEMANEYLRGLWRLVRDRLANFGEMQAREVVGAARFGTALQLLVWGHLMRCLTHGMEGNAFRATLRDCVATLDQTIDTGAAVLAQDMAQFASSLLWGDDMTDLRRQLDGVKAARAEAGKFLALEERPRPPIDLSKIQKPTGPAVTLEEITNELGATRRD